MSGHRSLSRQAGTLFRNDPQTRATEKALLRLINLEAFGLDDGDGMFAFKYYRDTRAGPPSSGERTLLVSFLDLQDGSGKESANTVNVGALSRLVFLMEVLEDGS